MQCQSQLSSEDKHLAGVSQGKRLEENVFYFGRKYLLFCFLNGKTRPRQNRHEHHAICQDILVPLGPIMVDINLICSVSSPLANKSDILHQHHQVPPAGCNGGSGSDTSEERRKKVKRHISIDETPITHTYHQNSLETSSQSSQSPSEVPVCPAVCPALMTRSRSCHHVRLVMHSVRDIIMWNWGNHQRYNRENSSGLEGWDDLVSNN